METFGRDRQALQYLARRRRAGATLRAGLLTLGLGAVLSESPPPETASKPEEKSQEPRPKTTGFLLEEEYIRHTLGPGHPECPERLEAIRRRMRESGLEKEVLRLRPSGDPLPHIRAIHPEPHIRLAARQAFDDSICRLSVSGALAGVDAVCEGRVRNAFCALRPPGHHAVDTGEFGFCFYNNIAVASRYAQKRHGLEKILIVDWDYHHGNGTEWAFYDDPSVLFFSTHRLEAFPGSGYPQRRGAGRGEGFNINAPLPGGAGDDAILRAFETQLAPAAERFEPDLVMISAGFDSRKDDLLGDFAVTDSGFARLTRLMMDIAERYASSRLVALLEGGYNTEGLALAVEAHVAALLGKRSC